MALGFGFRRNDAGNAVFVVCLNPSVKIQELDAFLAGSGLTTLVLGWQDTSTRGCRPPAKASPGTAPLVLSISICAIELKGET